MKLFIISALVLFVTDLNCGQSTEEWFDQKWLDENYLLKWKTNHFDKVITFRVEVITKGWVGFGFSRHGETTETDLVIGWVDDWGHSTFNDFWVNELGNRSLDMSQDWKLLSGEENATHTLFEFRRHLKTCDEFNDLEIYENDFEESNIFFTYSLLDPNNIETIGEPIVEQIFHLNLFEKPEIFTPKETDIEIIYHWLNSYSIDFVEIFRKLTIAPESNILYCLLKKKAFLDKRQVIKFDTIIYQPYNDLELNHHFAWMGCQNIHDMDDHVGLIFPCYETKNISTSIRRNCATTQLASILNNKPVVFPNNTGLIIDPADNPYFLLEAHLINTKDKVVDVKLSFRVWMTKQLRQFEANIFNIGAAIGYFYATWGFIVPPKQSVFTISAVTSSYCFDDDQFGDNGIYIFKMNLHSHNARRAELRHYRNDNLIRLWRQRNYDSQWQPFRSIKPPINLRRGDKLVNNCDYNSIGEEITYTGPHEHCFVIAYYYPVIKNKYDVSYNSRIPYETMIKITGLEKIDGYDNELYDNIIIRKPVKYNNTKLIDFISENKYKIKDPKELEELQISADMMECCQYTDKPSSNIKPCRLTKKPPGLYESVLSNRKQKKFSIIQCLDENKH